MQSGKPLPTPHGSAYWVIDTEALGEHERSRTAFGPYDSIEAAENWLRKDAEKTFLAADKSLRDMAKEKGWAAPVLIVEVKKTVVAVPNVKVTVKLKTPNDPSSATTGDSDAGRKEKHE